MNQFRKVDQKDSSKASLGAYFVGAYLFSVPAFAYSGYLDLSIIPQIMGSLLVAYAILDVLGSQRIKIPFEIGLYGMMGFFAAITYHIGANPIDYGQPRLITLIKVVIATLACTQLIKDETDLFMALKMFSFSVLFVLYQNLNDLQSLRMAYKITEDDRFAGTLANANTAAIFSLTVIWASVLLLLHSRKGLLSRAFFYIQIGTSLVIIYYSGSKKGLIGIGLFVFLFARLLYIRQSFSFYRKKLVILVSSLLIIIAGYFIYTSPFFFRIQQLGESASDMKRILFIREAITVWLMNLKNFFIGVGYGKFRMYSSMQDYAHATPLELLASQGIIGFFFFMGFIFFLFSKFLFLYISTSNQELKSTFFSSLIFLFLYSFFLVSAVLHDSRELLPILGCLAAFGQYHLKLLRQSHEDELRASTLFKGY